MTRKSAPRSAEPRRMSKEMKRAAWPQDCTSLSGASTCWPASPACESVNNQTSGREPQTCVGVTTSKPFSMITGLQSRLLATDCLSGVSSLACWLIVKTGMSTNQLQRTLSFTQSKRENKQQSHSQPKCRLSRGTAYLYPDPDSPPKCWGGLFQC